MVGRRVAGSPQLWESFSLSLPIHLRNYLKSGIQMFRNSNVQKFQASKDQNSAIKYLVQFFAPGGWLEACALILCLLILLQVQNKTFCTNCICPAWCLIRSKIKVMISLGHFIMASLNRTQLCTKTLLTVHTLCTKTLLTVHCLNNYMF